MPPEPLSRAARQERTRAALVVAARRVFARDGFHGARLELIAREAGFSKGAVYSNFTGKAELFLAAVDLNLAALLEAEAPGPGTTPAAPPAGDDATVPPEDAAAIRGFAIATLEFIATAARHEDLTEELAVRYRRVIDAQARAVDPRRTADEGLTPEELGVLLTALDQGFALLTVGGVTAARPELLTEGLRRLLVAPAGAAGPEPDPQSLSAMTPGAAQDRLRTGVARQERG
ncbi:MAG: TetR/AcrR family transcriptional regulator [Actinotalea sp.]|nr:TetR/AcrR family transcriptional regulator [Actinotalea sp.]